jgi:hypothetical protein
MVFNTTFNNISVISWRSVLLVEEKEYPEKTTDLLQVTHKETLDENDARDFIDAYLIEWQKHTQEEDNTQFTGKYKAKSSK